ncbi:hypothetical protein P171DRAFT_488967 [Karstenula rhodostoma CBS 690.94]|uniref:Uncharacterized protein n=1 Tax=Karstenula rhodostoma CBS 690.94 TaxID=1392251 RepID=A0A9P4PA06_9PLEO|nr:hypothetical protein P171DRAFT_488967 [Karstenula rhodostoma CBS 690.94]
MNSSSSSSGDTQGHSFSRAVTKFGEEDLRAGSSRGASIASLAEDDPIKDRKSVADHLKFPQKIHSFRNDIELNRFSTYILKMKPDSTQTGPTQPQPSTETLPPPPSAEFLARLNARPDVVYYPNRTQLHPVRVIEQRKQTINGEPQRRAYASSQQLLHQTQLINNEFRTMGLSLSDILEEQEEEPEAAVHGMDAPQPPVSSHEDMEQQTSVAAVGGSVTQTSNADQKRSVRWDTPNRGPTDTVSEISTATDDESDEELRLTRQPRTMVKNTDGPFKAVNPTQHSVQHRRKITKLTVEGGKTSRADAVSSLGAVKKDKLIVRLWSRLRR